MSDSNWIMERPRTFIHDLSGVIHFAWSMFKKLRQHRHKASWVTNGDYAFFRERVNDELIELDMAYRIFYEASQEFGAYQVMLESADAGNFLMMIHERARRARHHE